jgi:hypothetical protein
VDYYSVIEVEALADSLATGRHRDPDAPPVSDEEAQAREAEDRRDAASSPPNRP